MNTLDNFEKSLGTWAEIEKSITEREVARVTFIGTLESSTEIEKFSNWFVALVGAAIALVVSNLGNLKTTVEPTNLRWGLHLLIASGGIGSVARVLGLYVDIYRKVSTEVTKLLLPLLQTYQQKQTDIHTLASKANLTQSTKLNFDEILKHLVEPYPRFYKRRIRKSFEEGMKDPLFIYKRAIKCQVWQSHTLVLGVLIALASAAIIVLGI